MHTCRVHSKYSTSTRTEGQVAESWPNKVKGPTVSAPAAEAAAAVEEYKKEKYGRRVGACVYFFKKVQFAQDTAETKKKQNEEKLW